MLQKTFHTDPWETPALNENISKRLFEFSTAAFLMERKRVCTESFFVTYIVIYNSSILQLLSRWSREAV